MDILILGIGCAEHVVGACTLQTHAVLAHVEDVVAKCAAEQHAQIPVLVLERVAPRKEMLGCTIADVALVAGVSLRSRNLVAVVVEDKEKAVLVDAGMLIAIELADLAAFLHAEEVFARTWSWLAIEVEVSHLIDVARKLGELRFAHAPVDAGGPLHGCLRKHIIVK